MRLIKIIPNDNLSIQLYSWNHKYILKYEQGLLEQTYKIPEFEVADQAEVEKIATDELFLRQIEKRFLDMWASLEYILEEK